MTGLGLLALSRHQFREALEWGEQAHQLNPQAAHIYGVIGDAYVELGRYRDAWDTFQKMVDRRPDLSSYSRVSYARELTGDIPGAIKAMEHALDAGGPYAENTNWTRVQLGHLYFNSGDLSGAEAEYRKVLARSPNFVHAQAGLARVMAGKDRYAEAIAIYGEVVEMIPLPEYVIALGDVHRAAGHSQEAARLYALVRIQQRLYQANGVNTDLEMALFDADHDQDLDSALTRARQEYQRRSSIWAADVLAWTLYKSGAHQEALVYSQEALKLGTKDALLLFHAGMINYQLGNLQEARALLEQALSINAYFSVLYQDQAVGTLEELRAGSGGNRG
jgi:pentatricopeptide repeat protein